MTGRKKYLPSTKGVTMIEALVGISLMILSVMAMLSLSSVFIKGNDQARVVRVSIASRINIEAAINNPGAWQRTLVNNSNMACVFGPPGCAVSDAADGFYDLVLYDSENNKVSFDPQDENKTRYSLQGGLCPEDGSDNQCPLKFNARWKPLCETYPCERPQIHLRVSLDSQNMADSGSVLNQEKYRIDMTRASENMDVRSICESMNGMFDLATGECLPRYAGKTCAVTESAPYQVVQNVTESGDIICAPLYRGTCNATQQIVSGFDDSGNVSCTPKVCPCRSRQLGWTACSASCGGGVSAEILDIIPALNGGAACAPSQVVACNTNPCPTTTTITLPVPTTMTTTPTTLPSTTVTTTPTTLPLTTVTTTPTTLPPTTMTTTPTTLPPTTVTTTLPNCLGIPRPPRINCSPGFRNCGAGWFCSGTGWEDASSCTRIGTPCP